jgi:hypothetical protein
LFIVLATNFVIGERWIQKYIVNNVSEFKGTTVTFEETLKASENIRRVDVVMQDGTKARIYYEFKSVGTVPPEHFSAQFINDLNLPGVESLDQIKWIFDGSKVSSLDKVKFIDELRKANIPESIIIKWTRESDINEFYKLINNNFDNIFLLK